jgi:hypothetical protein
MSKSSSELDNASNIVTLLTTTISSRDLSFIDAICINCNKRFKSMRSVSMHLRMTSTRHAVNFMSYGNYDKKTGLKEKNHPETCINF